MANLCDLCLIPHLYPPPPPLSLSQEGGGVSSRDEPGDKDKGQEEGVGEATSGGAVQLAAVNDAGGGGGSSDGQTNPLSSSDKAEGGEDSSVNKGEEDKD